MFLQLLISFLVQYSVVYVVMCLSNQSYHNEVISGHFTCRAGLDHALLSQLFPPKAGKQARVDNVKEKLAITIQGGRSSAWARRVQERLCMRQSFLTSVLYMFVQTAGLAGAQAELCAVCHGERRQQGHVHQKRGGQCAQQKPVRDNFCWKETPPRTVLPLLNSALGFSGETLQIKCSERCCS